MRYLDICQRISANSYGGYSGCIRPKIYLHWAELSPFILILEGIHQFSVRMTKLAFSLPNTIYYIPVQLRDIKINENFSYEEVEIKGDVRKKGELCEASFTVHDRLTVASGI